MGKKIADTICCKNRGGETNDLQLYNDHMLSPMAWGVLELPNKTTPATDESVSHIFERYKEIVQQRPSSMD